ncbi:MAG: hypothetical protein HC939_08145 [Pleurocapsa sp. SU_5_0]|nr:hypothetical protein [Pleurocapsa sp. SU_5_0]
MPSYAERYPLGHSPLLSLVVLSAITLSITVVTLSITIVHNLFITFVLLGTGLELITTWQLPVINGGSRSSSPRIFKPTKYDPWRFGVLAQ